MPQIHLDQADAIELGELLTFLTDWHATDHQALQASLARYVGHPAYGLAELTQDLHRFAFLLGNTNGQALFS